MRCKSWVSLYRTFLVFLMVSLVVPMLACDRKGPKPQASPGTSLATSTPADQSSPAGDGQAASARPATDQDVRKAQTSADRSSKPPSSTGGEKPVMPKPAESGTEPSVGDKPSTTPAAIPEPLLTSLSPDLRAEIQLAQQRAKSNPADAAAIGELGVYYLATDWPVDAVTCFSRACELAPASFPWRYYLALAYERSYNQPEAIRAYQKAMEIKADYAPLSIRLGNVLLKSDAKKAQACFQRALELVPDSPEACFGLGESARAGGDSETALRHYQKALELAPNYASVHNALAEILAKNGQEQEAAAQRKLRDSGGPPPRHDPLIDELARKTIPGEAVVAEAQRLADAGRLEQGVAQLEELVKQRPNLLVGRNALGVAYSMQGKYSDAAREFDAVVATQPDNSEARCNLGGALLALGKYGEAEQAYRKVLEAHADSLAALQGLAESLLRAGRSEEGLQQLRKAVEAQPKQANAHFDLAAAHVCLKKNDAAIDAYLRGRELLKPNDQPAATFINRLCLLIAGRQSVEGGKPGGGVIGRTDFLALADKFAERKLDKEAEATRNYLDAISANAIVLAQRRQHSMAVRFLNSLMDLDSGGLLLNALGQVRLNQGRFEEASSSFRQALEVNPDLVQAKSGLGAARAELGELAEAERLFQEVLDKQPDEVTSLLRLAKVRLAQGKTDEAIALSQRMVKARPDDASVLFSEAEILARADKGPEAIAELKKAVEKDPNMVAALYMLGALTAKAGDSKSAKDYWQRVIKAAPGFADAYISLAQLAMKEADWAGCVKTLRAGLQGAPDAAALGNALAWCLATCPVDDLRSAAEAVQLAEQACKGSENPHPEFLDTLAAAYAANGRFPEAIKTVKRAIEAGEKMTPRPDLESFKKRLKLYETGKAYREER